jgi:hypothetical protein
MHDAVASWDALDASTNPIDILSSVTNPSYNRLNEARNLVKEETEKCNHTPPKFSKVSGLAIDARWWNLPWKRVDRDSCLSQNKDSRIALLTIHSPYQVHPSVATRWSGSLRGAKRLQVVMCANTGFGALVSPEVKGEDGEEGERYVHFSCRIANAAKARGESVNIIEILHEYAATDPTFLSDLKAAGEEQYARGHKEAPGGVSAVGCIASIRGRC